MPMREGSKPGKGHHPDASPSGLSPSACARSALMTIAAAAPSVIGEELPAVTVPVLLSK